MNGYLLFYCLFAGIFTVTLSLMGCCTARVKDKCSVILFVLMALLLSASLLMTGSIFLVLETQEANFTANYCDGTESITDSPNVLVQIAYSMANGAKLASKSQIDRIDDSLMNGLNRYMCKVECPCDPIFYDTAMLWSYDDRKEMDDRSVYHFDGDVRTFSQCYKRLLESDVVTEEERLSLSSLLFIQDLESELTCIGFCEKPRFWFFRDFYEGPPVQNCITAFKDHFRKLDSQLGYSFLLMGVTTMLTLFSMCGICRSTDMCFQQEIEYVPDKLAEESESDEDTSEESNEQAS
jgi:hypothetical protein